MATASAKKTIKPTNGNGKSVVKKKADSYRLDLHVALQEHFGHNSFKGNQEKEAIEQIYPQCTNISIDFGIMEKADNVYIIPSSFGWSDLGTWNSAWDNMEKDYLGNAVAGKNVMIMSFISILHGSGHASV